ncbi:putative WD repeat-containing protein [Actinoplanes sp. SE50]|uniref:helix-turn-helix domain-containing protein n=1 Tax=unclassified Actinoplanes TaxID=2626549 RepID=UPI00023ECEAB|nr:MULTISPECIES: helix-turn-helix domain-containing protein [unclassified Actinoplanes]AEV84875.1 putative WD repeat-containing protein [Actinoplanes sp. SE50/110]ATO83266.1 putative WD repeat-containing protein [Actinoplanes sp. SE50]SLM00673.1 putative WD repeat-containing protein [Actinoplanes sp. SE50/110]
MSRTERPLDPSSGPAAAFALQLRELRVAAGSPKYLQMARRTGRSGTALAEAAGGDHIPQWETVEAYVRACGGDPAEWADRWEQARDAASRKAHGAPPASVAPDPAVGPEDAARDGWSHRRDGVLTGRPMLLAVAAVALVLLGMITPRPGALFGRHPDTAGVGQIHVARPAAVTLVAFSRFGRFASGNFAVTGAGGAVEIWDTGPVARRHTLVTGDEQITEVQFDPLNRDILATAGTNGLLRLWNTTTGKSVLSIAGQAAGHSMTFAFDPRRRGIVATIGAGGTIRILQTETGRIVRELHTGLTDVTALTFDCQNEGHLAAGGDGALEVWNSGDGTRVSVGEKIPGRVTSIRFDPLTRNTLAITTAGAPPGIWDASNGRVVRFLRSDARPTVTAFNPLIRNSIATDDGHGDVQIFDASTGLPVHTLHGRYGPITSLEYAPDGATLAVGARDGVVGLNAVDDW